MLSSYLNSQTPIVITLQNKIRVAGRIKAFDSYIVIMDGHKREIVYRHAMSTIAPGIQEEVKKPAPAARPAQAKAPARAERPAASQRPAKNPHHQPAMTAAPAETGLNNSMKEGLLKWMREQKAAK